MTLIEKKILKFFPQPIFHYKVENFEKHNENLSKYIYELYKNDKDESKIVEIFNDIKNELKTHDLELRIQDLESKFAEDFNQNTFDEINRLKKEQNIN